jgi:hypothetical protein
MERESSSQKVSQNRLKVRVRDTGI